MRFSSGSARRRLTAVAATGVLAVGGLTAGVASSAQAATACKVTYAASQWPGGMSVNMTISNTGDAWSDWALAFAFPASGQSVQQGWSATWSQSGQDVTAKNVSWNGSVPAGGTLYLGFNGAWSGSNPDPASFAINGTTCNGGSTSTTSTTTTKPVTTTTTTTATTTKPVTTTTTTTSSDVPSGSAPALHVSGNKLVTASGETYRLLGANRSGGEFSCIQGYDMWNGPMDQASVAAMKTWNIRTVRVPLNEECWLGTSDVPSGGASGATYQQNVKDYVNLLLANGITPILEMHWNYGQYTGQGGGCTDVKATCQKPMPDAQYGPQFWTGVANAFKDNRVVFDLFNEPFPDAANGWADATEAWKCWRDGGTCTGITYEVAGMQSLLDAVRATGNTNVLLVGGLTWSNDLSQWLTYKPSDPTGNLAAFAHVYNFNGCITTTCWDTNWAPVAASVPLTLSEIGENDCGHSFIDTVMDWADSHGVGYLGWTWNNWDCSSGPSLITDYAGTPTAFGQGLKDRLAKVVPTSTTTIQPTTTTMIQPVTTTTTTTTTTTSGGSTQTHVDNPYVGAQVYVNPDWSAKAAAEPGGSKIANEPTGVWLDSIAAINADDGSGYSTSLTAHLDNALAQGANLIQVVIYDLPGRDCAALASNGELGPTEIGRYESEYIDPIAAIEGNSKYAGIRIVNIVELDSLPNLVTNAGSQAGATAACATMLANGNYVTGTAYALGKLHGAGSNIYNYMDIGHHGWLGWDTNFAPSATLFTSTAQKAVGGLATVDGFISNTANYSATTEPYFTINTSVNGTSVRQSKWVDWNFYVDEVTYDQAMRTQLISDGFPSTIGMLIDTSRNGWGGSARPTAASTSTDVNTFVNASRIDRRLHAGNWCNQDGAGLGERPKAAPAAGIDAYVWIKPPGESDGSSSLVPTGPDNPGGKGFDQMCDPTYTGNARNGNNATGALANSPVSGAWFSAQFQQLMANAYPAL